MSGELKVNAASGMGKLNNKSLNISQEVLKSFDCENIWERWSSIIYVQNKCKHSKTSTDCAQSFVPILELF